MSKAVDAAADLLLVADEIRNDALRADWPIPILEVLQQPEIEIPAAPARWSWRMRLLRSEVDA